MHFPHAHRGSYFTTYRMGDWKLIYYYESQTSALFNLKDDLSELHNLINEEACGKIAAKLAKDLTRHLKKTNAIIPVLKSTGRPVRYPDGTEIKTVS